MENTINEVLTDPYLYAAIYARKSNLGKSNSIEIQIDECEKRLYKENLVLYKSYFEKVSATKKFTYERKEYSKLIIAAKEGCFKTLIIYSLDRLIRNNDDWIQTKIVLNKYDIKLIICDRPGYFDINSIEGQIMVSIIASNADAEAKRIRERTSNGKRIQRENGIFTCGIVPLGYERKKQKVPFGDKEITRFIQVPIEIAIVKYIFYYSKDYIIKNKELSTKCVYESLIYILSLTINKLNANKINVNSNEILNYYDEDFINELITHQNKCNDKASFGKKIKYYLNEFKIKLNKNLGQYILNILEKPTYVGLMLIDAKLPLDNIFLDDDNKNINKEMFVKITNLEGCIDFETFQYVYSHLLSKKIKHIDTTPNFLFKNKLKCTCGKKLYLNSDGFLHCNNLSCTPYYKVDILKLSLFAIVDNIFKCSDYGFSLYEKQFDSSLSKLDKKLLALKAKKTQYTLEYVKANDDDYAKIIVDIAKEIVEITNVVESYRSKLNYISKLKKTIIKQKNNFSDNDDKYNHIREVTTDYILSNEGKFNDLLNEIVKEVRVVRNDKWNRIHTEISYDFTGLNSSGLY